MSRPPDIDAALYSGGHVYLFRRGRYLRFTGTRLDPGYPLDLPGGWELSADILQIDAALSAGGKNYLFSGGVYYRLTSNRLDPDYPRALPGGRGGLPPPGAGGTTPGPATVPATTAPTPSSSQFESWTLPGEADPVLPGVEVVHYPTFDEVRGEPRRISAYLLPPATTFDGPRPVLVDLHGGPAQQASPTPAIYHQAFRRVGITVIRPNVRGSAGYGRAFLALDDGRLREDAVRDIGALLDWVATRPDLDSERIALMGGSYGGYLTLASLVRYSDRVSCGIDMFGISDLVAHLEASRARVLTTPARAARARG